MKEEGFKKILDREIPRHYIQQNFKDILELLQEVTNYGSRLIPRIYELSDKTLPDTVIIGVLLKHAVGMLDAVEILISQAAVLAAHVPARSLFEAYLYIRWILDSDTERRAKQFFVWNLRRSRSWRKRFIPGTEENKMYSGLTKNSFGEMGSSHLNKFEKKARKEVAAIDVDLKKSDFKDINAEFDRIKNKRFDKIKKEKKEWDKPWYAPWGVRSINKMADELGLSWEYMVFYDDLSNVTHPQSFSKHISFGFQGGKVVFEPIRKEEGIGMLKFVLDIAFRTYETILDKYRPSEAENFKRKYMSEWQERFTSLMGVK